jgi:hypothetical protein
MIFARKGLAETLLDLKMSLGLDIAVGSVVSFKLREKVSILLYSKFMSANISFIQDGNTRHSDPNFEIHLAKEMVNQAPKPLQAPARGKKRRKNKKDERDEARLVTD